MAPSAVMTVLILMILTAGQPPKPAPPREPLLTKLLRIAGLTAAPSQMRGPADDAAVGNIWMVNIDRRDARALTTDGGYRSPIFLPDSSTLLALRGNAIVRLGSTGGNTSPLRMKVGVAKLVGVDSEDPSAVVVLLATPRAGSPLASVSLLDATATALPFDAADASQQRVLAQIRGQERTYQETTVYTRTETKSGLTRPVEWIDVFVKRGAAPPQNVSACDGVNCVQPALSPDRQSVAFIKVQD
ncbi:MAG TPA: hypothetical protein VK504_16805 [Vicinamibacterales bacterium]|jgi:hypothetical protein|nr:hypothetical protein [Vicinamibacterales bacterium]